MVQPPISPPDLPVDVDHHIVLFPTRSTAHVRSGYPVRSPGLPGRVRSRLIGQVAVLEVAGPLSEVVEDLDRAVQLALADGPRGVVCDLSGVPAGGGPVAIEMLATAGRHPRDWPGTPVAVVCPERRVHEALVAHPLGRHLIVAASILPALSAVRATPTPVVEWLRLAPHPTAPRAARGFVVRPLLDWGLNRLSLSAGLVLSELVANSTMDATRDIDLSIAWNQESLRLTVRDNSPELPLPPYSHFDERGRRLTVVTALSRAFGVLPTADGGKVVWAVLNAARPRPSTSANLPEPESALQ